MTDIFFTFVQKVITRSKMHLFWTFKSLSPRGHNGELDEPKYEFVSALVFPQSSNVPSLIDAPRICLFYLKYWCGERFAELQSWIANSISLAAHLFVLCIEPLHCLVTHSLLAWSFSCLGCLLSEVFLKAGLFVMWIQTWKKNSVLLSACAIT